MTVHIVMPNLLIEELDGGEHDLQSDVLHSGLGILNHLEQIGIRLSMQGSEGEEG